MSDFNNRTALITGASSGLGEEFAVQLADLGLSHVVLTARRADRLEKLRLCLVAAAPRMRVETIVADLAVESEATRLLEAFGTGAMAGFSPDILINNAGLGDLGTFETSDPARIEAMMAVNMVALTRITRWALPGMIQRRCGWICNVGSTAGLIPLPSFAVYAATKAYVNSFSEALRVELRGSGVNVLALCPGPVETEFGEVASRRNSFPVRAKGGRRARNARCSCAGPGPAHPGAARPHSHAAGGKHAALAAAVRLQSHERRFSQGTRRTRMKSAPRLAVLGSGRGSNFVALQEAILAGRLLAHVGVVVSDNPDAPIVARAHAYGLATAVLPPSPFRTKLGPEAELALLEILRRHAVEWIVLAGYMRVVKEPLLAAYPHRVINIHPSLLPAFKGLRAWEQALRAGVAETGCTVHFVNREIDAGEIIAQRRVPVLPGDTPESLHARIQEAEHALYPEALQRVLTAPPIDLPSHLA